MECTPTHIELKPPFPLRLSRMSSWATDIAPQSTSLLTALPCRGPPCHQSKTAASTNVLYAVIPMPCPHPDLLLWGLLVLPLAQPRQQLPPPRYHRLHQLACTRHRQHEGVRVTIRMSGDEAELQQQTNLEVWGMGKAVRTSVDAS